VNLSPDYPDRSNIVALLTTEEKKNNNKKTVLDEICASPSTSSILAQFVLKTV